MADTLKISYNYLNPYEEYYNKLKTRSTYNEYTDRMFKKSANYGELDSAVYTLDTLQDKVDKGELDFDDLEQEYRFDLADNEFVESVILNELFSDKNEIVHYEEEVWNEGKAEKETKSYDMSEYELNKMFFKRTVDYNVEEDKKRQLEEEKSNRNGFIDFLSVLGDIHFGVPVEMLDGMLSMMDGIFSTVEGLIQGIDEAASGGDFAEGYAKAFKEDTRVVDVFSDVGWREEMHKWMGSWSHMRDVEGNYTTYGSWLGGISNSIGQMLPSMFLGKGLSALGASGKAASTAQQVLYYTGMSANTFREFVNDPRLAGVSAGKKLGRAVAQTAVEWAVQAGLNKMLGPSMMDKAVFGYKGASKAAAKITTKQAALKVLGDAAHEGLEETLQQYSNHFVDRLFAMYDENYEITTKWDFQTMMTAFGMGALSSIAMSTFSVVSGKVKKNIKARSDASHIKNAIDAKIFEQLDSYDSDIKLLTKQLEDLQSTPVVLDSDTTSRDAQIKSLQEQISAKQSTANNLRKEYKIDKLTEKAYKDGEIVDTLPKMNMLKEWQYKNTVTDVMQQGMQLLQDKRLSNKERGQILGQMIVTMENIAGIFGSVGAETATKAQEMLKAMQDSANETVNAIKLEEDTYHDIDEFENMSKEERKEYGLKNTYDKQIKYEEKLVEKEKNKVYRDSYAAQASVIMNAITSMRDSFSTSSVKNLTEENKEEVRKQTERITKKEQKTVKDAAESLLESLGSDSLFFENNGPEKISPEKTTAKRVVKKSKDNDSAKIIVDRIEGFRRKYKLTGDEYNALPKEVLSKVEDSKVDMKEVYTLMEQLKKTTSEANKKKTTKSDAKKASPTVSDVKEVIQTIKDNVIDEPVQAMNKYDTVDSIAKAIVDLGISRAITSNIRYKIAFNEIYRAGKDLLSKPNIKYTPTEEDVMQHLLMDDDFIHDIVWTSSEQVYYFIDSFAQIIEVAKSNNTAIDRQIANRISKAIETIKKELMLYSMAITDAKPELLNVFADDPDTVRKIKLARFSDDFVRGLNNNRIKITTEYENGKVYCLVTGDSRFDDFGEILSKRINTMSNSDLKQLLIKSLLKYNGDNSDMTKTQVITYLRRSMTAFDNKYENGSYFKVNNAANVQANRFFVANNIDRNFFKNNAKMQQKANNAEFVKQAKVLLGDKFNFNTSDNNMLRSQMLFVYNKMFENFTGGNYSLIYKLNDVEVRRNKFLDKDTFSKIYGSFNASEIIHAPDADIGVMTVLSNKIYVMENKHIVYKPFLTAFNMNGQGLLDSSISKEVAASLTITDLITDLNIQKDGTYTSQWLSKNILEDIKQKYLRVTPETVYAYLHKWILNASKGNFTIAMRRNGTIVAIELTKMKYVLAQNAVSTLNNAVKSKKELTAKDVIISQYLLPELSGLKISFKNLGSNTFGYFDGNNAIVLNNTNTDTENTVTLMHEYKHAIQKHYAMLGGFSNDLLSKNVGINGNIIMQDSGTKKNSTVIKTMITDLLNYLGAPKNTASDDKVVKFYKKYLGENTVDNIIDNSPPELIQSNLERILLNTFVYLTTGEMEAMSYNLTINNESQYFAQLYPTIVDEFNNRITMPWGKSYNVDLHTNNYSYRINDIITENTTEWDGKSSFLDCNFAFVTDDGKFRINKTYPNVEQFINTTNVHRYAEAATYFVNKSGDGMIWYDLYVGTSDIGVKKYSALVNMIQELENSGANVVIVNPSTGLRFGILDGDRSEVFEGFKYLGINIAYDEKSNSTQMLPEATKTKNNIREKLQKYRKDVKELEDKTLTNVHNLIEQYANYLESNHKSDVAEFIRDEYAKNNRFKLETFLDYFGRLIFSEFIIDKKIFSFGDDFKEMKRNAILKGNKSGKRIVEFLESSEGRDFKIEFMSLQSDYYSAKELLINSYGMESSDVRYDDRIVTMKQSFYALNPISDVDVFYDYMAHNINKNIVKEHITPEIKKQMIENLRKQLAPNLTYEEFENVKIPFNRVHRTFDESTAPFVSVSLNDAILGIGSHHSTEEFAFCTDGVIKVKDLYGVILNTYDTDNVLIEAFAPVDIVQKSSTVSYTSVEFDHEGKDAEVYVPSEYIENVLTSYDLTSDRHFKMAFILKSGNMYSTGKSLNELMNYDEYIHLISRLGQSDILVRIANESEYNIFHSGFNEVNKKPNAAGKTFVINVAKSKNYYANFRTLNSFIYHQLSKNNNIVYDDGTDLIFLTGEDKDSFLQQIHDFSTDEEAEERKKFIQYSKRMDTYEKQAEKQAEDRRPKNKGVKSLGGRTTRKNDVYVSKKIAGDTAAKYLVGKQVNKQVLKFVILADLNKLNPELVEFIQNGTISLEGTYGIYKWIRKEGSLDPKDVTSQYTLDLLNRTIFENDYVDSPEALYKLAYVGMGQYYALKRIMKMDGQEDLFDAVISASDFQALVNRYSTDDKWKKQFEQFVYEYNKDFKSSKGTDSVSVGTLKVRLLQRFDGTIDSGYDIAKRELNAAKAGYKHDSDFYSRSLDENVGKLKGGTEGGDLSLQEVLADTTNFDNMDPASKFEFKETLSEYLVEFLIDEKFEDWIRLKQSKNQVSKSLTAQEKLKLLDAYEQHYIKVFSNKDLNYLIDHLTSIVSSGWLPKVFRGKNEEADTKNTKKIIKSVKAGISRKAKSIAQFLRLRSEHSKKAFLSRYGDVFNDDYSLKSEAYQGSWTESQLPRYAELNDKLSKIALEVRNGRFDHGEAGVKAYDSGMRAREQALAKLADKMKVFKEKEQKLKSKIESLETTIRTMQIGGNNFTVTGPDSDNIPQVFRAIMETTWTKFSKRDVKYLSEEGEVQYKQGMNDFMKTNAELLANMTNIELQDLAKFILENTIIPTGAKNATDADILTRRYMLYKAFLITYILTMHYSMDNKLLDNNTVLSLERTLKEWESDMGRGLGVTEKIAKELKPFKEIMDAFVQKSEMEEFFADRDSEGKVIRNDDKSIKSKELDDLEYAIRKNNQVEIQVAINNLEKKGWERWAAVNGRNGKSIDRFFDRFWKFQRMAMLSSPGTWARNAMSNTIVKATNAASDVIGRLFTSKTRNIEGQYRMDAKVTEEVDSYITKEFFDKYEYIDYKGRKVERSMYDMLSDGLTKWTPGENKQFNVQDELDKLPRLTDKEKMNNNEIGVMRDAYTKILTTMIGESMRSKIFMNGQFGGGKFGGALNKVSQLLFKVLTDDPWIKSATKKYFGKILQEKINEYNEGIYEYIYTDKDKNGNTIKKIGKTKNLESLSEDEQKTAKRLGINPDGLVTEPNTKKYMETKLKVLQLFSEAYTLASNDYMHRSNFITKIEKQFSGKSKTAFFIYKQFLPFASAGWNWFVEGLNYTPMGLVKAIVDYARLEKRITKAETQLAKGQYQGPDIKFMQYLTKRRIGKGVIGTIGFIAGCLLAGFGLIAIDDEDDKVKLTLANVKIDISDIFGSSSMLAGGALVSMFKDEPNFWGALSAMSNEFLEDSIFTDLHMLFSYDSVGDAVVPMLLNKISTVVPNIIKNFNKLLYVHTPQYSSGMKGTFEKWGSQIVPGLVYAFPRRFDPYTGEYQLKYAAGGTANWFQKFSQTLGIKIYAYNMSDTEKEAAAQGVRKSELTCRYEDIGDFDSKHKAIANEYYGNLNKKDLEELYSGKKKYKVLNKDTGKYVEITYSKMTTEQKKAVIERIMNDNSKIAKIYVYTQELGGKYYATDEEYKQLKKFGISKNIYKETRKIKGFK